MSSVRVSKLLSQALSDPSVSVQEKDLVAEFTFWAERGFDDRCTDMFSYKKKDDLYRVFHAHMRPVQVGSSQREWDALWEKSHERGKEFLASRRRSDCYLMYTHSANRGYLLIDIIFDPGAHEKMWDDPDGLELREYYGECAENFLTNGIF